MIFEVHTLKSSIKAYIKSIFYYKDFIPGHTVERVIPTGHIFILFELDGIPRNTYDNDSLKPTNTFTGVWISGMHKNYISISAHHKSEMFVIQFKPFGAHPFFHLPIQNLNDKIIPAESIFGEEIIQLREDLLKQETPIDKFSIAEKWLEKKFNKDLEPPEELLSVIGKLQKGSVTDYAKSIESYPHTQKHLIDQFKKYVGLTPKYYQRILRFNEILQQIKKKKNISWSQIAYHCGYADQSHFIKEFNYFSGFNPKEFIEHEFDQGEPNFFPLDREG